jgi:hypothetical protein
MDDVSLTAEEQELSAALLERGRRLVRPCWVLTEGDWGSRPVGVWAAGLTVEGIPPGLTHRISVDCRDLNVGVDDVLHVFAGHGANVHCVPDEGAGRLTTRRGTPLAGRVADSYPQLAEDWAALAPPGYDAWRTRLGGQGLPYEEHAARLRGVLRAYQTFYTAHDPVRTVPDLYAVAGGWGHSVYEGEWAKYPGSTAVLFTVRDAEPWLSVRRTADGRLVARAIIT